MLALLFAAIFCCAATNAAAEHQHTCLHGTRGNEVGEVCFWGFFARPADRSVAVQGVRSWYVAVQAAHCRIPLSPAPCSWRLEYAWQGEQGSLWRGGHSSPSDSPCSLTPPSLMSEYGEWLFTFHVCSNVRSATIFFCVFFPSLPPSKRELIMVRRY